MTLQAAIDAELPYLRTQAEARMTSRATIRRKTGEMVQDETTGVEAPEWTVTHAAIPFRLGGSDSGDSASRRQNIGGVEVQIALRVGHLPATTSGVREGDLIDVTAGENVGTVWRVVEGDWADQQTARRFPLVSIDRPEEWP